MASRLIRPAVALGALLAVGCGAGARGGMGTTPTGLDPSAQAERFEGLEGRAVALNPDTAAEQPEVAETNVLMRLEATVPPAERDPVLAGFPVDPLSDWTVGATEEGEEVRVEFLEPEGGRVVMASEADDELPGEVTITWIVRYERRNIRLTEEGSSLAVHVTPVAVRLEGEGIDPMYWISGEAPEPPPE